MQLIQGQNIELRGTSLRYNALSDAALDVSALVVDSNLQSLSSDASVFYNQLHSHEIRMGGG